MDGPLAAEANGPPKLEELLKIRVFQWSRLGEELGISEETLRDIENRHPHNEAECRRKMFAAWLQAGRDVSRTTVINALRAMDDNPSADWYEAYTKRLQHKPREANKEHVVEKGHLQQRKNEESNEAVDSSSNRTELSVSNKSHTPSSSSAPEAMEPPPADNVHTSTNETTPLLLKATLSDSTQSAMGLSDSSFSCFNCFRGFLQVILAVVNLIVLVLGLAVMIVGIWAQVRGSYYFIVSAGTVVTQIPVLLIIVGLFTLIFGVVGLIGSVFATKLGGRIILGLYGFVLLLLVVMEIAGGIAAGVKRNDLSDALLDQANKSIVFNYTTVQSVRDSWTTIQTELHCCGALSFTDYTYAFKNDSVPGSCCNLTVANLTVCAPNGVVVNASIANTTGLIYSQGCVNSLEAFFQDNLAVAAGIAITFGLLQIVGVCMSCFVAVVGPKEINKYEVV